MKDLAQEIIQGRARAIARAISLAENDSQSAREIIKKIFPYSGHSTVIGITGAPGSGKSTLVNGLIPLLRKKGNKVGVVAVDPSSPFSGGAILGDRIRMMSHSTDPQVFIRSMATRGQLGGLAKATGDAITILEAGGKDSILIETVGVGQDEVEIVKLADIIVVVLFPGTGDDIQIFKAGIMEIADVFVINKADSPEVDRIERQLKAVLELGYKNQKKTPVVKTVATEGKGLERLMTEINHLISSQEPGQRLTRRKKLISSMLRDILTERIYSLIAHDVDQSLWEEWVEKVYKRQIDPYSVAEMILSRIKGKPGQ